MTIKPVILSVLSIMLFSFLGEKKRFFKYPKNKDAVFTMSTDKFKKFKEEWLGEDYYLNSKRKEL